MKNLVVFISLLSTSGCAVKYNHSLSTDMTKEQRLKVAGDTMKCAGDAGIQAFWYGVGGSTLMSLGSSLSASEEPSLVGTGLVFGLIGLGLEVNATTLGYQSYQYQARAGEIIGNPNSVNSGCKNY